jgi:hypothetical protein
MLYGSVLGEILACAAEEPQVDVTSIRTTPLRQLFDPLISSPSRRIKHIHYASFKLFVKYEVHMIYSGYFGSLQKEGWSNFDRGVDTVR